MASCTWSMHRTLPGTFMRCSALRQIRHRPGVFDELLQCRHHHRAREKLAEKINLRPKLLVRNWLHEFLCSLAPHRIILCQLRGSRPRNSKRLSFTCQLRHQANGLRARGVDRSPGKKQIAHECVSQVALEPRDAPKSRNESKPQLRERKARHFIRNNDVASQGQLQTSAQAGTVDRSNGHKGRGVDRVQNSVDALENTPDSICSFLFRS